MPRRSKLGAACANILTSQLRFPVAGTLPVGSQASNKQPSLERLGDTDRRRRQISYRRFPVTKGGKYVDSGRKRAISPGNLSQTELVDRSQPFAGLI
jgi:hypothetical protein